MELSDRMSSGEEVISQKMTIDDKGGAHEKIFLPSRMPGCHINFNSDSR
jgi:hypothetical protein